MNKGVCVCQLCLTVADVHVRGNKRYAVSSLICFYHSDISKLFYDLEKLLLNQEIYLIA